MVGCDGGVAGGLQYGVPALRRRRIHESPGPGMGGSPTPTTGSLAQETGYWKSGTVEPGTWNSGTTGGTQHSVTARIPKPLRWPEARTRQPTREVNVAKGK